MTATRQLAAIMFTDIVGYTRLMGEDEEEALELLRKNRKFHKSITKKHHGKWLKEMGDGTLISFQTISDAVYCAGELIEVSRNGGIALRIGIHQGEVTLEEGDIFGDGVNVASRIEPLAKPGQILVSGPIHRNVKNKAGVSSTFVREAELKNVDEPVKIYALEVNSSKINRTAPISSEEPMDNSIAVLPFVNMSNDPDQDFFCDGISEEIINTLVQFSNLKVSGRTSSFSFKGKNIDLIEIGKALGVSKVLEGSIRKAGNRIRITAQLIETSNGFHLWSNKYDRQLDDIFAIQDEIAEEIGNQLNLRLTSGSDKPNARQQTQNIEAYELYLKGRSYYYTRGKTLFDALQSFQKALEIDPEYALASAGISDTYVMLILHGYLPAKKTWPKAIEAAKVAMKYAPELAETYNSQAIISLFYEWDWDKSEAQFKKAISINPSFIQAYVWYGYFLQVFVKGNFHSGLSLIEKAIELDPLSGYTRSCLCNTEMQMGNYTEAVLIGERVMELDPSNNLAQLNLGSAYLWAGELQKAKTCFVDSSKKAGLLWHYTLPQLHLKLLDKKEAKKTYAIMEEAYESKGLVPTTFAIVCAYFGEMGKASEALSLAAEVRDPALPFFAIHHKDGEILHKVPGYSEIIKKWASK